MCPIDPPPPALPPTDLPTLLSCSKVHVPASTSLPSLLPLLRRKHTSLTLHARHLPAAHLALLADFLSGPHPLLHLSLAHVALPARAPAALLAAIASSPAPLQSVSLRAVGISAASARKLAHVLRRSELPHLRHVDVANNAANWPGVRALRQAAAAAHPRLVLDVSGNLVFVERLNALTHLFGALLALPAGLALARAAVRHALPPLHVASLLVFAAALVTLMACSAVYHGAFRSAERRARLRKADHCCIFVLIAGTYTPFVVCYTLDPPTTAGPAALAAVWALAAVGVVRSLRGDGSNRSRALLALATGWVGMLAIQTLLERLQGGALAAVVAGGLVYSLGMAFYLGGKKIPVLHVVWHVAVMVGGGLHYYALWRYVVHA